MASNLYDPAPLEGWTKSPKHNVAGTVLLIASGQSALGKVHIMNSSAAASFVQVFDAAAIGSVNLGTTVPDLTYITGAAAHSDDNFVAAGLAFKNGICIASTTTAGGSTGSATGVDVTIGYR